eukprot:TRINITY_DN2252_c0_g1_i4.p1 TRINITY_DN2252_c0_g1~~TRINITY_DN2252_c0_g1_i4.p1  ORF type:complete len:669 (+),score=101.20 TRINITY_DN2252_c0_g1_i4:58-2064(+)
MVGLPIQLVPLFWVFPFAGSVRRESSGEDGVLSVSESFLCNKNEIDGARKLLGEETKENLMSLLVLEEAELDEMLTGLGVKSIKLETLCESAVGHIKDILHKDIPAVSDEACLTPDCSSTMIVSDEKLAEEDAAVDLDKINLGNDLVFLDNNDTVDQGPYKPSLEQMVRRLLAILFRVHPQIDILETEDNDNKASASSSLAESSQNPSVDSSFSSTERSSLQRSYQGASARVSSAIRKVNSGVSSSMLQKYFKASSGFTSTLKRHLSLILDSLSRAYAKNAASHSVCRQGASAFVSVSLWCSLNSQCGSKQNGRFLVNYCPTYFRYSSLMDHTVIHEHSHHFGTVDKIYHKPQIFSLSASNMQKNADNYAHFAKDVLSSYGGSPSPPTWRPPSPPSWSPPSPPSWSAPSPPSWSAPSPPSWSAPSPPSWSSPSPPSWSSPAPAPAPSSSCFPPDAQVRLESQVDKAIASLAPGDALYDEAGMKNDYLFDFHEDDAGRVGAMVSYLRIEHSLQKEGRPLLITKDHLLFACTDETICEKEVMPAGELAAGTHFVLALSTENGSLVPSKITSVEAVVRQGFAGPFSSSGTLIVEGVLASSYALLSDRQVSLWKRGPAWLRKNTQNIAHLVSLPLRWARALGGAKSYITSISGMFDQLSDALLQVQWSVVSM